MKGHDEYRHGLGAYVTGSLDPTERAEMESHLAGCSSCRDELSLLSPLPAALLRGTSPELLAPDPGPAVIAGPGEDLGMVVARAIAHRSRRSKLRAAGAAAVLAAVIIAVAFIPARGTRITPAPSRVLSLRSDSGVPGVTSPIGTAALDAKTWGTQLVLTLSHRPTAQEFVASIAGPNGNQTVGEWGTTPNGHVVVQVATVLQPGSVEGLTIRDGAGAVVLHS